MYKVIYIIHIIVSIFLVVFVFLQKSSNSPYSFSQTTNSLFRNLFNFPNIDVFLCKLTFLLFIIFISTSLLLAYCLFHSVFCTNEDVILNTILFSNKYFELFDFQFTFKYIT